MSGMSPQIVWRNGFLDDPVGRSLGSSFDRLRYQVPDQAVKVCNACRSSFQVTSRPSSFICCTTIGLYENFKYFSIGSDRKLMARPIRYQPTAPVRLPTSRTMFEEGISQNRSPGSATLGTKCTPPELHIAMLVFVMEAPVVTARASSNIRSMDFLLSLVRRSPVLEFSGILPFGNPLYCRENFR